MARSAAILLVYGTGGHQEQAKRLLERWPEDYPARFVHMTPSRHTNSTQSARYRLPKLRGDYRRAFDAVYACISATVALIQLMRVLSRFRLVLMISTGSGVAIIPALAMRILQRPVIYFESWSRITLPSISGNVMYRVSSLFFVQHRELLCKFPRAYYRGRL